MSDGNPKYKSEPRPESTDFFINGMNSHKVVYQVEKKDKQYYNLSRKDKSDLIVFLTNIYIVGIADVHEIISKYPDVNCIVTISRWNSYTEEAKSFCRDNKIGLFKYNEFYGALYYDNEKFYKYEPPKKDEK